MVRARVLGVVMLGLGLTLVALPAQAQEAAPPNLGFSTFNFTSTLINASAATAVRLATFEPAPVAPMAPMAPIVPIRPKFANGTLLSSLFVSTALMQALDLHSSLKAFNAGAAEGNPLMMGIAHNRAAFVATKAAVATATIFATRKLAKKNKVAAIVTLFAVNSAYAMIVSHNYNLATRR